MKRITIALIVTLLLIAFSSCATNKHGYKREKRKRGCDCPRFSQIDNSAGSYTDTIILTS